MEVPGSFRRALASAPRNAAGRNASVSPVRSGERGAARGRRGVRLRIVTWNLHGGIGLDGMLDVERIGRELAALEPDVAALQEVDAYRPRSNFVVQWREYGRRTGLAAFYGPNVTSLESGEGPPSHPGRWVSQYGNALLTRLPVRSVENHLLTYRAEGEGYKEQRGCLEVEAGPATWLCTHWGLHPEERRHQVQDILALAAARGPGAVAVLGDFNALAVSPEIVPLRAAFLDAAAGAGPTFPADRPQQRIDYCFLPTSWHVVEARVVETSASDHRPVLVVAETKGGNV